LVDSWRYESRSNSDYIEAINRALGVRGEFKPLVRSGDAEALLPVGDRDDVIDLEILP
jgi:hypothetical protein